MSISVRVQGNVVSVQVSSYSSWKGLSFLRIRAAHRTACWSKRQKKIQVSSSWRNALTNASQYPVSKYRKRYNLIEVTRNVIIWQLFCNERTVRYSLISHMFSSALGPLERETVWTQWFWKTPSFETRLRFKIPLKSLETRIVLRHCRVQTVNRVFCSSFSLFHFSRIRSPDNDGQNELRLPLSISAL